MLSEALVICLERLNRDRGKNLNCRFDFFVGQCVPVSVCYPTLIGKANGIKNEIETSKHYVISPSLRQILFVDRHWFFWVLSSFWVLKKMHKKKCNFCNKIELIVNLTSAGSYKNSYSTAYHKRLNPDRWPGPGKPTSFSHIFLSSKSSSLSILWRWYWDYSINDVKWSFKSTKLLHYQKYGLQYLWRT